jgi:hypothetical protein
VAVARGSIEIHLNGVARRVRRGRTHGDRFDREAAVGAVYAGHCQRHRGFTDIQTELTAALIRLRLSPGGGQRSCSIEVASDADDGAAEASHEDPGEIPPAAVESGHSGADQDETHQQSRQRVNETAR